ncbi:GAF domain-containing protein, partial [bacterium]
YFDLNANALSVLELPREQVIGNLVSVVIPDRAARLIPLCAKVLSSRTPHQYSAEAGDRSFEVCIYPIGEHTVVSTGVDVTARRVAERLEVARGEAERAEREWLAAVLDSISEEVYFTDTSGRYSYANPAALREFGHSSLSGVPLIDVVTQLEVFRLDGTPRPVEDAPPLRALRGEVVRDEGQIVRTPRTGELRYRQVSSAPVRDATGRIIGAVSVVRDLTAQRRTESALQARESRASALLALADRFRDVTDPGDIATGASTLLGEVLAIDRCGYGELDMATETVQIGPHWSTARVPPVGGCYHLRRYGSFVDDLKAGRLVVVEDTRTDPRTASDAAALEGLGVRSLVNVPIVESGRCVAMFFLNHSTPRHWSAEELQFIQEVADRTRFAAERRRHEQSIATELRLNSLLRDLGAKIVLEGEASKLFDEAVAAAMEITGASGGTLQLMDPTGTRLLLATVRGIDRALSDQFRVVEARSGSSCGVALARGKRTMVDFDVPPEQDPDGSSRK